MSSVTRKLYEDLRNIVPLFVEDTPKYEEIEKVIEYLKTNKQ
jgi:histidine ammonia-lyase